MVTFLRTKCGQKDGQFLNSIFESIDFTVLLDALFRNRQFKYIYEIYNHNYTRT
jgi:hypothetical protein